MCALNALSTSVKVEWSSHELDMHAEFRYIDENCQMLEQLLHRVVQKITLDW